MLKGALVASHHMINPTLDEVFDACKKCFAKPAATVRFWIKLDGSTHPNPSLHEVHISGLDHESGTPGMLIIRGSLPKPIEGHDMYSAFYDARDGYGHITLLRVGEKA